MTPHAPNECHVLRGLAGLTRISAAVDKYCRGVKAQVEAPEPGALNGGAREGGPPGEGESQKP